MERKMMQYLLRWRDNPERKALVISGSRQVGKTYLVDEFARENYGQYLRLDFSRNRSLCRMFSGSIEADDIYEELRRRSPSFRPEEERSILFLDEIQFCPDARSALKPLVEDGRADIIASGSLLSVKGLAVNGVSSDGHGREGTADGSVSGLSPMGYQIVKSMHAMDFEEYLWAVGVPKEQTQRIREMVRDREPFSENTLEVLNRYFRRHLVLGGLPGVVSQSLNRPIDWEAVSDLQSQIRADYIADVAQHCPEEYRNRALSCMWSMPEFLGRTNKRFVFSRADGRSNVGIREYSDPLDWISSAGFADACWNVTEPMTPLGVRRSSGVKMYYFDTGLLLNACEEGDGGHSLSESILEGRTGVNRGGIVENAVANMIVKCGLSINYFERDCVELDEDENEVRDRIEIDFIVPFGDGLAAVEVKSGKNRRSGSLKKLMTDERYSGYPFTRFIKLEDSNIRTDDLGVEHYPLFAAAFMDSMRPETSLPESFDYEPLTDL